jgi:catechol 2,3-dioxygenase-like lactoylglutathione lyase family enzyme
MARPTPSVVVFCADVRSMTTFYRALGAMRVVHEEESHAVLETDGLQLVIHGLAGEPQVERDWRGELPIRQDAYVKVCLPVESIADARAIASSHGGTIYPSSEEWEARGFRACDGHDPEGNVIQVREAVT